MRYAATQFAENLNTAAFDTVGRYDIPKIQKCDYLPTDFISFNYAKSTKSRSGKSVHFFIDDYQFERLWRYPERYIELLSDFDCVLTPDFSLYTDFPLALQIYNRYRSCWLGAYWQEHGMNVIPTVTWSDRRSYDWCFDGTPKNSIVAVSSVGTQKSAQAKKLFLDGWFEMCDRLEPETVIFYGKIPKECRGNIISVKAFQEKFREAKIDGIRD